MPSNPISPPLDKLLQAFDFSEQIADREKAHDEAFRALLIGLLDVMDSFDRFSDAANAPLAPAGKHTEQWCHTCLLIGKQLLGVLRQAGVVPIAAVGQASDPRLHEIIDVRLSVAIEEGVIVEELVRGYTVNGRVLRQSRVVIARAQKDKQK